MTEDQAALLDALAGECHALALEKGWYERPRELPELLCLAHAELSECLEAARDGNPESAHCPGLSACEEELADALIRLLDLAAHQGFSPGRAVLAKLAYNRGRPHRHGGKLY